ncbi:MAG: hypothetical protein ACR2PN_01700 [Luminiphilus sp.]
MDDDVIVSPADDDREHMYTNREYSLVGKDGWVDVRNLSIHIQKSKSGVKVDIYPLEHDGRLKPLATCFADYLPEQTDTIGKRVTVHRVRSKKNDSAR